MENKEKNIMVHNRNNNKKSNIDNKEDLKTEDMVIYQKYMELIYYTYDILNKYPKSEKFALVSEIKRNINEGLRSLIFAIKSYSKNIKINHLQEFNINLTLLKIQIRMSYKYKYISSKNYEAWSKILTDVGNMTRRFYYIMPKKIKTCFDKKLTFQKLLEAHYRAKKHKTYKREVIKFEMDLENNIMNLLNDIKNNKYKVGKYRVFIIKEPKERIISALPYRDRIVHQWYVEEFIKPYIVPKLDKDTYACLKDRGTHKAVESIQKQMRIVKRNYGDFWILKCDISKFFYNIRPNILFNIMKKYIKDKKLLEFTKLLILENNNNYNDIYNRKSNSNNNINININKNETCKNIKEDTNELISIPIREL